MNESGSYKIRPAGRHLLTIGRELIQDKYAAVVELVKNSYDADSPDVIIEFRGFQDSNGYSVVITDHGHGMSRDTVIDKWMVPSTPDKLIRKESPKGRPLQGRKGIGRYAAAILGSDLLLETVSEQGEKTTAIIRWEDFEKAEYLDDVEILIESGDSTESPGTKLTIEGNPEGWDEKQYDKLLFELRKLIHPLAASSTADSDTDNFSIDLLTDGMPGMDDIAETVSPFPLFDLFDYKIAGTIDPNGKGLLTYSSQKSRNIPEETIAFDTGPTGCGRLILDIRVYDRDREAIDGLIKRGLKDETTGSYLGRLQTRQLLNKYCGIGVYRNGFRIRPMGDPEFDWLFLNKRRVQNPSRNIGSDQVIGYVQIQQEELSGLIEKSARDGMVENAPYQQLKDLTEKVISELESRRLRYRAKAGLSRPVLKVERALERLFSYEDLKKTIRKTLSNAGVGRDTANDILKVLEKDEASRNEIAEELRNTVAIYQGQATLGKIINVVLHEGRRPLNYFKNQIPNLNFACKKFSETRTPDRADKIIELTDGVSRNAESFVELFKRIDPLAAGKRGKRAPLKLMAAIQGAVAVFENEISEEKVQVTFLGSEEQIINSWPQDIYAIFTNLVDNSLFWMREKQCSPKEIRIEMVSEGNELKYIDYRDTGPGIDGALIESGVLFEPQFSTKPNGTGLGLAIAGEAATRNKLELLAFGSDAGAYFRLQPLKEN